MASAFSSSQVSPKGLFDGYVRITFDALAQVVFSERHAWEDESLREDLAHEDVPALRAGYCEWSASGTARQISIGWAWFVSQTGRVLLAPGGLSTNLMLVGSQRFDLGCKKTNELLHAWLSGVAWQTTLESDNIVTLVSNDSAPWPF
ncbi:DUF4902 domain-containing protein [Rhodanobacter sp. L36]|uniref:DUF4902 domain-containing protein n=1 Tax=Rhodanobacter sp. L36 TaxID=1747221 RepID=UPI00131D5CF4|nr:DUF4902 domain-containing protein [Rhodanobacter sp. L36]